MDEYIAVLHAIITQGRNTNSYKFALWRALANLAANMDVRNPKISKLDLALLFVRYYWPLEVKYHIRQAIDPDKDPIVMVLVRQLLEAGAIIPGEKLQDFEKRMPGEYKTLVVEVAQKAFDDVIPRFHIVHGAPISPATFTFTGKAGKAGDLILREKQR